MKRCFLFLLLCVVEPPHLAAQEALRVTRVMEFGRDEAAGEVFGLVADMAFGSDNTVLVLDALNAQVKLLDLSGDLLRTVGRKGDGPGEFRMPNRLLVSSGGFSVIDPPLARVSHFSQDGSHIDTRRLPDQLPGYDVQIPLRHGHRLAARTGLTTGHELLRLTNERRSVILRAGPRARESSWYSVAAVSASGSVDTIFKYDHGFVLTVSDRGVGSIPRYWGSGGAWAVAGDSIVATVNTATGELAVFKATPAGVQRSRTGRVPLQPMPLGEAEWTRLAHVHYSSTGRPYPTTAVLLGPAHQPQLGVMIYSSEGDLWLQRMLINPFDVAPEASESVYLIMPADGSAQKNVRLPRGFTLWAVRGDLLLGKRRSELGTDVVEVWRRN